MNAKKPITKDQEFEIMKMVLDKFLWLGFAIMAYGLYLFFTGSVDAVKNGLMVVGVGAIVLVIFVVVLAKEFEYSRS